MCPVSLRGSLGYQASSLCESSFPWWYPGLGRPVGASGPQFSHLCTGCNSHPDRSGCPAPGLREQLSTHGWLLSCQAWAGMKGGPEPQGYCLGGLSLHPHRRLSSQTPDSLPPLFTGLFSFCLPCTHNLFLTLALGEVRKGKWLAGRGSGWSAFFPLLFLPFLSARPLVCSAPQNPSVLASFLPCLQLLSPRPYLPL